jgi:hypothetical protein
VPWPTLGHYPSLTLIQGKYHEHLNLEYSIQEANIEPSYTQTATPFIDNSTENNALLAVICHWNLKNTHSQA